MRHSRKNFKLSLPLVIFAFLAFGCPSRAEIVGPYAPDAFTLHLWHFDDATVPIPDVAPVGGTNLSVLGGGATLNNTSFPGFGSAVNTLDAGQNGANTAANIDAYIAPVTLANSAADNLVLTYADPTTGAFTYEAVIRVDFDPFKNLGTVAVGGTGRNTALHILSGEQDGAGGGIRSWQWRIDPTGTIPGGDGFTVINPRPTIQFINVNNGASVQVRAALIPTNGVHAIVSNGWYHVAVTYNGNQGAADNLKLFWTVMDGTQVFANEIYSTTMTFDLAIGAIDFSVGNVSRGTPNGNYLGLIDEVRISSVDRGAGGMMFVSTNVLIISQPAGLTVAEGQSATFTVLAAGISPLTYQWRFNQTPIPDANQSAYTISSAQLTNAGSYDVIIANPNSTNTSTAAELMVRLPANLSWNGSSIDWDLTTAAWNDPASMPTNYTQGDRVRFDDAGAASGFVSLKTNLTPSQITIDSGLDYDFVALGGSGGRLSGSASLTKSGSGTVIFESDNDYTGGTAINQGLVRLGIGGAGGSVGNGPLTNNGTIAINRTASLSFDKAVSGNGEFIKTNTSVVTLTGSNSFSGKVTVDQGAFTFARPEAFGTIANLVVNGSIGAGSSLGLNGGLVVPPSVNFSITSSIITTNRSTIFSDNGTNFINAPLQLSGDSIIFVSANGASRIHLNGTINGPSFTSQFALRGTGSGSLNGAVNIPNGSLAKTDGGVWEINSSGHSYISTLIVGGTIRLGRNNVLPASAFLQIGNGTLDLNGNDQTVSGITNDSTGTARVIANTSTNSDSVFTVATTMPWSYAGRIIDGITNTGRKLGLTVSGASLTLSGTNTYTGDTTISSGTILLVTNGSISGSANIILGTGATLDASGRADGRLTLGVNQTLKGTSTINLAGSLSSAGRIQLKLNKAGTTLSGDQVQVSNDLVYGGTLDLVLGGAALAEGDSIKLFNAASYSGFFSSIAPASPGPGLVWNTSTLTTDGTLRVSVAPANPPLFSAFFVAGNSIILGGSGGSPSGLFRVLASTNIGLPIASWTPVSTNLFDGSGNFSVTNAISTGVPQTFYLLQVP